MNRLLKPLPVIVATALLAAGCSGSLPSSKVFEMTGSPDVPAASGEVKYAKGANGITNYALHVKRLAVPVKVAPSAVAYVVWLQPPGSETPRNVGTFLVDNELNGKFESKTEYREFDVFITAEDDVQATAPKGRRLLWAKVRP